MGTSSKGFLRSKEVERIKHIDGKEVKYKEIINIRGKNPNKKGKS